MSLTTKNTTGMATIYCLLDGEGRPFYIGSTSRDVTLRATEHFYQRRLAYNVDLSLMLRFGKPPVKILQVVPAADRHAAERDWIVKGRAAGWPLVNVFPPSQEWRAEHSRRMLARCYVHTAETRERMSRSIRAAFARKRAAA